MRPDPGDRSIRIAFIPSVSGGLGHVTRLGNLARALQRTDPALDLCFVLSELRLRSINIEAVKALGYPVRMLPNPVRHERDDVVRGVLGDVDAVIEDTERRLIAYRPLLPRLKTWISIPMLPLWDELFLDVPLLRHADHILYTYPPTMPVPSELAQFGKKLTTTGPLLDPTGLPSRARARRRLGLGSGDRLVTYAPRGFPFGREFGQRVLSGVVGGFLRLRGGYPRSTLALTAVDDVSAVQPPRLPPLDSIEGVTVMGMLSPSAVATFLAAADIVILEGTSTLFATALVRTPIIMVPGPIYETSLEGSWVADNDAGLVIRPEHVTRRSMQRLMSDILESPGAARARSLRLAALIGSGGMDLAVATVLRVLGRAA
jgi:hypothetical protein